MEKVMGAVMRHIRNFFETGWQTGTFSIRQGVLEGATVREGETVAIEGSLLYGGVYRIGPGNSLEGLGSEDTEERFSGRIWFLRPPRDFVTLCGSISGWLEENPAGSPVTETIGSYSYGRGNSAADSTWQGVFRSELDAWRKMFTEVEV